MYNRKNPPLVNALLWLIIIIATAWCVFPFYWAIITSFKPRAVILTKPAFIPWLNYQPTLYNWQNEFTTRWPEISHALLNSLIIATGATIIAVALGTLAGYGLARFRYRRWSNRNMSVWFLSQRFLPPVVTVIPFFLLIQKLGLIDTQLGLILANATFVMPSRCSPCMMSSENSRSNWRNRPGWMAPRRCKRSGTSRSRWPRRPSPRLP